MKYKLVISGIDDGFKEIFGCDCISIDTYKRSMCQRNLKLIHKVLNDKFKSNYNMIRLGHKQHRKSYSDHKGLFYIGDKNDLNKYTHLTIEIVNNNSCIDGIYKVN